MTKKRKPKPPGPAWLADMVIALGSWRASILVMCLSWLWRHWRGVGAVMLAALVFVQTGSPALAGAALVALYGLSRWRPAKRAARWWDHDTLSAALVDAGVLRMVGDKLPTLSFRGKPKHSEHGTTVVVGLPQAKGPDDVKGSRLAAALRVPAKSLACSQDEDDPANVVRIHVGETTKASSASPVASSQSSEWGTLLRIGHDARGQVVELATHEANTLVAGRPGSGKTSLSRILLAHYLLDPSTSIYLLDGKGSVEDYGAARPMCEQYVSGTDEACVPDTLAMLATVLDLVRGRNAAGGDHSGVLLLLEEFQDVRAAAGKEQRDQLDSTLGRIVRMGRAVSVHVLVSTQRPTTEDLPAGTRNLLSQRVALMLRNGQDAGLVLGATPALALPKRRGQALFTDGGPVVGVELDRLTDSDWRKVCKRAAQLRAGAGTEAPAPATVVDRVESRPVLALAPPPLLPGAGLVDEVVAILEEDRQLAPTDLFDRLSPATRMAVGNVRAMGVELSLHWTVVTRGYDKRGRVWRLTERRESVGKGR